MNIVYKQYKIMFKKYNYLKRRYFKLYQENIKLNEQLKIERELNNRLLSQTNGGFW